MNSFISNLKQETNFTETENGAIAHKSTLNAVYDMFALGGAYRNRSDDDCIVLFKKALKYSSAKEVEYSLIGMAYYLQEKLDEAVEYFNLAIDANDNYDKAYEGRNQAMLENHLKIIDLQESLKKYF